MISSAWMIFISSLLIAFSGALMPGPLLTATIAESSRKGFIAGPAIVLGHGLLEVALIIGLISGLESFFRNPLVIKIVGLAGGAFLLWMGISMFMSAYRREVSLSLDTDTGKSGPLVVKGITFSLSNPYWIIWWATVGLTYIFYSYKLGMIGLLLFFSGHILADLLWYSAVAAAVVAGKKFISDRIYRGMIALCSLFLMALAISFIIGVKIL